jgi:SAM-dependent methyltransferase
VLVIKSINGDKVGLRLEELRAACADRDDILVIDKYVSSRHKNSYMAVCDCYVSLHRSEGFGLTMAEAMAHGKPVIATGYSGNLVFMSDENSYLVPHKLVPIPPGCDPYPQGAEWAEPDTESAARLMRHVYENRAEAAERGQRAVETIRTTCSPERTGAFIRSRMHEIHEIRATKRLDDLPKHLFRRPESPLTRMIAALTRGRSMPHPAHSALGLPVTVARRTLLRFLTPLVEQQHALAVQISDLGDELDGDLQELRVDLQEQRGDLQSTRERLQRLTNELVTPPYMADSELLRTTDDQGRPTIGFGANVAALPNNVYRGFEDVFRGPEEFIRDRQRVYVSRLAGHEPVLDVGCGRGELLELLRNEAIAAKGIDLDSGMVARCKEKGLEVEQADAITYLESLPDDSLGAIFSAQVIEHLGYDDLLRLLQLSRQKLKRGGVFIAETVNPHSIQAFKMFWLDPTHRAPIFPEVVVTLCQLHDFASAFVLFPNGSGELERDRVEQGEYAVVATTASS